MSAQLITHEVVRAILIAGDRLEPGDLVDLGPVLGAELRSAGKVRIHSADNVPVQAAVPDATVAKPQEPAPRRRAKPAPVAGVSTEPQEPLAPQPPAPAEPA